MLFYIFLIVNKSQTYSLSNSLKQLTAVVFSRRYSNRRKNYIYFQQWMNPCFLPSLIWVFLENLLTIRTIISRFILEVWCHFTGNTDSRTKDTNYLWQVFPGYWCKDAKSFSASRFHQTIWRVSFQTRGNKLVNCDWLVFKTQKWIWWFKQSAG